MATPYAVTAAPFSTLARLGLSVFPLRPRSQRPAIHSWMSYRRQRPTDLQLAAWDADPAANVAVVTGALSGVIVLDVDGPAGARSLLDLGVVGCGALPRTWWADTGRGLHLYFQHPSFMVRDRVGLLPGLDVRGEGGYVAAPPSRHPDGRAYDWVCSPADAPLAEGFRCIG